MSVVYVDFLFTAVSRDAQARRLGERTGDRWCHLWSEDVAALHRLAKMIGMKRKWFQDRPGFPHYDLTPGRRKLAVLRGAVEKSLLEWKREKLQVGSDERRGNFSRFVAEQLNPERTRNGLAPMDAEESKKCFEIIEQAQLNFMAGIT